MSLQDLKGSEREGGSCSPCRRAAELEAWIGVSGGEVAAAVLWTLRWLDF